jgi:hypothetical protein
MKSMLFLEFRNCLNRNEFKFIFILLILISIGGFAFACIRYYGLDIIYTRSAFEMCLLREITARMSIPAPSGHQSCDIRPAIL